MNPHYGDVFGNPDVIEEEEPEDTKSDDSNKEYH